MIHKLSFFIKLYPFLSGFFIPSGSYPESMLDLYKTSTPVMKQSLYCFASLLLLPCQNNSLHDRHKHVICILLWTFCWFAVVNRPEISNMCLSDTCVSPVCHLFIDTVAMEGYLWLNAIFYEYLWNSPNWKESLFGWLEKTD